MGLQDFEKLLSQTAYCVGARIRGLNILLKHRALKCYDSATAAAAAATATAAAAATATAAAAATATATAATATIVTGTATATATGTATATTFIVDTFLPRSLNHPLNPLTESCSDGSFNHDLPMLEVRCTCTSFFPLRAPMLLRRAWEPWPGVTFCWVQDVGPRLSRAGALRKT